MGIVRDLTVSMEFTIVSVMEFGQQLVDFTSAIKEMKDARVLNAVAMKLRGRVEKWNSFTHIGSSSVNLKNKVPRWEFVGIEPADARPFVHPSSKRRFFCTILLNNFSSEESTVLGFFSGGVFTKEALMLNRDVIYFSRIQLEAEFMVKYGKLLLTHNKRIKDWFATYKKNHGHVDEEAPQAEQTRQKRTVTVAARAPPFVPDDNLANAALEQIGNITRVVHYVP
ncbi:hypothetical protein R1sor_008982 [Riccia sorocarpa]|uniref:Uncharacterized protein n=1 Tax=Riccia sorocarpa TaxID=122646 RepID=A0ABD3H539_9MARC